MGSYDLGNAIQHKRAFLVVTGIWTLLTRVATKHLQIVGAVYNSSLYPPPEIVKKKEELRRVHWPGPGPGHCPGTLREGWGGRDSQESEHHPIMLFMS